MIFGDDKSSQAKFLEDLQFDMRDEEVMREEQRMEMRRRADLAEKRPAHDEISKALPRLLESGDINPQELLSPADREFYETIYGMGLHGEYGHYEDVNPGIQHFRDLFIRTPIIKYLDDTYERET